MHYSKQIKHHCNNRILCSYNKNRVDIKPTKLYYLIDKSHLKNMINNYLIIWPTSNSLAIGVGEED